MRIFLPLAVLLLSACAGAKLEKQQKQIDELSAKAGSLLVQVKEKSDEADAAKAAKAETDAKLAEAEGKLKVAEDRIASLTKSNADLSSSLGADKDALGGKLQGVIAEKDALAQKLADAQKEKLSLERLKGIYRSARDKATADLAKTVAERDALVEKLKAADAARQSEADAKAAAAARRHDDMGTVADAVLKEMQAGKVGATETSGSFVVTVNGDLLFDAGSAKIRDEGAAVLEKIGRALKSLGPRDVAVTVHTDNAPIKKGLLGGFDDSWSLTAARAAAIAHWLHEHAGLDPAHLSSTGAGEFRPLKPNDTDEGRAENRRAQIEVKSFRTP